MASAWTANVFVQQVPLARIALELIAQKAALVLHVSSTHVHGIAPDMERALTDSVHVMLITREVIAQYR